MRLLFVVLLSLGAALPAPGQEGGVPRLGSQPMPYHVDPGTRETTPNLSAVPAIRFLTTDDFPPFNFRDGDGQLIGFHIDLARRICAIVSVPCTIQSWPWDQVEDALAENQGDALIAGIALDQESAARFDFSTIYLALPGRFVARTAAAERFDPTRLGTSRVAVREGSAHERFVAAYLPGLTRVPFETEIEGLEAVEAGTVDLYFGDAMRASFWLNDNLACCSFAGAPYFNKAYFGPGLAIALPIGASAVRQAVDWALVRLIENGAFDELYLRWFPVGFY